jgi:hypothetical protein
MTAKYCGIVGVTNSSAGSEIGFLFLTSCNPYFPNLQFYATLQMVIVKKAQSIFHKAV